MTVQPSRRLLITIVVTVIIYSLMFISNRSSLRLNRVTINAVNLDANLTEGETVKKDVQVKLAKPKKETAQKKQTSKLQTIDVPPSGIEILEDVDVADNLPQNNQSSSQIFFIDTSTPDGGILELGAREACAIESAAFYHPGYAIYVLVTGKTEVHHNDNSSKYYKNIRENFKNVFFRSLDPVNFTVGSPVEVFFAKGKYRESIFYETHLADILRLVVLWKYGGLYMDLDVVVLKNFQKLGEDFLGKANEYVLMSGTMQFSASGIGHQVAELSLLRLARKFNGKGWGSNGPKLITKVMGDICMTKMAMNMNKNRCQGMSFLLNKQLIPVRHFDHKLYFDPNNTMSVLKRIRRYQAFTAHLFHHKTKDIELTKDSICAYTELAKKHCPKTFSAVDVYFN